jgi:hypothetical protein
MAELSPRDVRTLKELVGFYRQTKSGLVRLLSKRDEPQRARIISSEATAGSKKWAFGYYQEPDSTAPYDWFLGSYTTQGTKTGWNLLTEFRGNIDWISHSASGLANTAGATRYARIRTEAYYDYDVSYGYNGPPDYFSTSRLDFQGMPIGVTRLGVFPEVEISGTKSSKTFSTIDFFLRQDPVGDESQVWRGQWTTEHIVQWTSAQVLTYQAEFDIPDTTNVSSFIVGLPAFSIYIEELEKVDFERDLPPTEEAPV